VFVGSERLNKAAVDHERLGEHLWIAIVTYGLTALEAASTDEGVPQNLDAEHLLAVMPVGCYLCEQPYDIASAKPCKGQPASWSTDGTPIYRDGTRGEPPRG
jgi:hypothetical protein